VALAYNIAEAADNIRLPRPPLAFINNIDFLTPSQSRS
jgi:hypothetical protein